MPFIYPHTSITGKSAFQTVSSSFVAIASAGATETVKVNTLMVTNSTGSAATVTVDVYRNTTSSLCITDLSIPVAAVAVLIGKDAPIYLEASDSLRIKSDTDTALKAVCSYEIII